MFVRRFLTPAVLISSIFSGSAFAGDNDINSISLTSQKEFSNFAESVTNVFAYKTMLPGEPLGVLGFDIGIGAISSESQFKLNSQSPDNNHRVNILSVHAQKGLPGGFDLGLQYNMLTDSDASTISGELRYAIVEGGTLHPSLSVGGQYTKASGMDALDYQSFGVDLGVSKGFANFTPYANIGMVSSIVDPTLNTDLKEEKPTLVKVSAGLNINLFAFDVLVGYDQVGDNNNFILKAGYRF
ncbi:MULTISPECIES: hypothetical protein [Thiomicrorhabdus]|uniref:Outer membrane protein beta-barrel domain-containing protein n=1 Tax=Thiomicrorhabdus xiamenensis TaxID=2739063 RepID=A0A7D4SR52_9GAMM|nr:MULTISPECIES: hypothetical protein [Thiomicrorhabdus]MBO1924881.1 hypothetical protein [Thiomicrorhabdus sp. 6S3-12]QKI88083.1 hypothetical protein HQN79_00110 [Thiomicrorhabdus xiamenensis]